MSFDLTKLKSLFKFSLGNKEDAPIIGVDVGTSAVKIVQLHNEDGVPTLDTYGELQLGPYADLDIGQTASVPAGRLIEAFVDIIRESSVTGNSAALSISYAASFSTTIIINALDEADIAKQVPIEARKYIPVPLSEVTLDWFTLSTDESAGQTKLFLVAIHNEALNQLRNVLTSAGLSLTYTELEPFSTSRAILSSGVTTAAILDLGASATKVYLVQDGIMQKTHSIPHGGVMFTESISKAGNITFAQAETQKRSAGLVAGSGNDGVGQVLRDSMSRMTRELGKVVGDYEQQNSAKIETVLMMGGGAAMPGISAYMQDNLQKRISLATPFNKVAYPAFLEDSLKEAGPSFAVAVGAALRQFNS